MNELWTPPLLLVLFTIGTGVAFLVSVVIAWVQSIRETKEREREWGG